MWDFAGLQGEKGYDSIDHAVSGDQLAWGKMDKGEKVFADEWMELDAQCLCLVKARVHSDKRKVSVVDLAGNLTPETMPDSS